MNHLPLETVRGELVELRHVGADFFGIGKVRGGKVDTTIVGKLIGVDLGDHVEARGVWTEHPRFGRQLKLRELMVTIPSDASGVVAWLASRLPQLGRARASELVERFGATGIWEVIEGAQDRLLEVKGITPSRRDEIVAAYHKHRGERDRMVRLQGWGLTDHQIATLIGTWGDAAEERLREDPYVLCREVRGFGFVRADAVAKRMGVPLDSPARLVAGCLHMLREAEGHGHCYVPRGKLVAMTARLLAVTEHEIVGQVSRLTGGGQAEDRSGRVYRVELARAEDSVAQRVMELCAGKGAA